MPKSQSLSINLPQDQAKSADPRQARNPRSPQSPPPPMPARQDQESHEYAEGYDVHVRSPITSLPSPPSPQSPKHKTAKPLFPIKLPKSGHKLTKPESPSTLLPLDLVAASGSPGTFYDSGKSPTSIPDFSSMGEQTYGRTDDPSSTVSLASVNNGNPVKPSGSSHMAMPIKESGKRKDDKKHLFPRLGRKASLKEEDFPRVEKDSKNGHKAIETHDDKSQKASRTPAEDHHHSAEKERGFRDMMSSTLRNRSADRHAEAKNESSDDNGGVGHVQPARSAKLVKPIGREENGPGFLSSFGNKAAGGLGRAAKGLVKLGRSGSTNEREVPPAPREPYIPTVITQPLIDQTHLTRISKRLEDCRDKTEFWMPALPWRCIDYLNAKAPNSEGIYRVPGSDRDVKHWEQRFDKEHDIDLLSPGTPIYDINTIGSMLKNWLRALPDNIVPLDVQNEVQSVVTENGTKTAPEQAPQELKDALSNLPPFNYYLLFAITCHISLLNAHPETTKMHFTALRICLQPCLRISPLFFQWLVQDWRNCWQGCWTEKEYLEKEYAWLKEQEESASLAASIKQRDQQTSRQSERSVTPLGAVARDAPSRERDRSKASQKDSKKIKDDKGRALHAYENSALPSQSPSNAIPQQVVMGGSKAAVQALSQHKHTASNSSNRPPTAHAPLSTAFDPIQAAHATSQSNRASANSMPFGMEGRSTPETHPVRDASLPRKQQNGLSATKPGRDSSRDRAREHGLMLRLNEKDGKPEQSTEKRSERTADAADQSGSTSKIRKNDTKPGHLLAAPQLSPMEPISPMAPMDLHLQ